MADPLPVDVVSALQLAADARAHQKAAKIAEIIALSKAAHAHDVRRDDVEYAMENLLERSPGAPGVGEFFALEAAAVIGSSPASMILELHQIMSIQYRHPFVWEAFCSGDIWWWQACEIDTACKHLSKDAAHRVDNMLATAVKMMPWWKAIRDIEAMAKAADPEDAELQQSRKAASRNVAVEEFRDGHSQFYGRLSARDAVDFENAISEAAKRIPDEAIDLPEALSEQDKTGWKRAMAVGELARAAFGQDTLPVHQLVVHINADDPALDPESSDTGACIVERWGTLLSEDLPMFLADSKVVVKPVVDFRTLPPEHQHDPSALLRFAVQQRDPFEVFPYGTRPSRSCDLDHTEPFTDDGTPGQTNAGNLGPLSRRAHRAKHFGGFKVRQVQPGYFHWITPNGWEFMVGPHGTTKIADPPRHRASKEPLHEWADPYWEPPLPDEPPPIESQVWPILQHTLFDIAT